MRSWWSAICEEFDLTPSQGMALRNLDPERPLAMSTLADALACDASNVTGIVDKLESRGLIARRGADHDRRIKMLCVTQAGRALRDRLIGRLLQPPAAVASLSRDAKTSLTGILRNILAQQAFSLSGKSEDAGGGRSASGPPGTGLKAAARTVGRQCAALTARVPVEQLNLRRGVPLGRERRALHQDVLRLGAGVFAISAFVSSRRARPNGRRRRARRRHAAMPSTAPPLVITGYVDVGFAKAQGNGTSFPASYATAPPVGPADYYVDTFAPAVNSRGEAASTAFPPGTTAGGFLPRSASIGGKPSFLINTADVDVRYTAPELPVLIFTRLQVIPRLTDASGESTRLFLEQAFGRVTPIKSAELAISIGKFDSVFGIEYLENEANFRVGVTPSLLARYTTGQSTGVKVFYRIS